MASAHAYLVYGVKFDPNTPTYAKLQAMDWTPIEACQAKTGLVFLMHGNEDKPLAYVVGVPFAEGHSWQALHPLPLHNEKLMSPSNTTALLPKVLMALHEVGLGQEDAHVFGWWLVVRPD